MTLSAKPRAHEPQMAGFRVFSAIYTGVCALAAAGLAYLVVACWMAR